MEVKSSTQCFLYAYLPIERAESIQFAVECDINSKVFQMRTKLVFFFEKLGFSENKSMIFFSKSVKVVNLIKIRSENLEKIESFLKKEYLSEENAFNFLKSIFVKVGGRTICQW